MVEQWSHYIQRVRDDRPPGRRVFRILFSGVIFLSIISAGTYWMLFRFEGGEFGPSGYRVGARRMISTHAFLGQPDDFSRQLERSDMVVEGVIDEIYPPVWTTADGAGPVSSTEEDVKNTVVHIRTPVQLSAKRVFKGESVGDVLKFSFVGGQVGDTVQTFELNDTFKEGTRVIVFLAKWNPGGPASNVEEQALYPKMHLIIKGDFAQGPIKEIPMGDLLRQLERKP